MCRTALRSAALRGWYTDVLWRRHQGGSGGLIEFELAIQVGRCTVDLSMPVIIEAVERMFREKGEGRVEMPPKPGIHTQPDAFIHAMPAYIPSLGAAGLKWISGYPGNQAKGLPYITGLLILNDPDTGVPSNRIAPWVETPGVYDSARLPITA